MPIWLFKIIRVYDQARIKGIEQPSVISENTKYGKIIFRQF
jgi:hypothetical protein